MFVKDHSVSVSSYCDSAGMLYLGCLFVPQEKKLNSVSQWFNGVKHMWTDKMAYIWKLIKINLIKDEVVTNVSIPNSVWCSWTNLP